MMWYRIIQETDGYYWVQVKRWWFPCYVTHIRCCYTVSEAEQIADRLKNRVVKYL